MTEGSNQGLFVIVAIVIFGIFVSMVYLLFGDNLKPALSSIFKDSFGNVNNVMGIGSSEDSSGNSSRDLSNLPYDDWVKALENMGYVVATDSDFGGTRDGEFYYKGTAKKVIIPKIIKGVTITSTNRMFENTSVEAVAMNNPNVTDMYYMFADNQATSLDVSNLFTENVTNMECMFAGSQATELNLTNFDTSKVTNMSHMFMFSKATSLDLSSFNTSNVTDMFGMFMGSSAKTGYARTLADADKFNNTTNKAYELNFVVKQQ